MIKQTDVNMLHASGSSLFSIMRCSRMSSVSFASSSSSSSARVRQRRGDWTTVRVHARQEGNSDDNDGTTSDFKAKFKSFAKEMNVTDPNDLVDMKPGAFVTPKDPNPAKNQIREDEQRALNVATSTDFTKAMLGVTVGLLVLYLLIGPPPIEPPLYNEV